VRLDARLTLESPQAVAILYKLDNARASPLEVFDVLLRIAPSGASEPDPELAYVVPEGGDGAAIGKYLVAEPEDREVEAPEVVLARRLAPGASLQGRMRLPLPLRLHHPYAQVPPAGPRRLLSLRVLIGFIDTARIPPNRPVFRPHAQHPNLSVPVHGNAMPLQEIVSVSLEVAGGTLMAAW